ncbi:MAG: GlsB/YeaQ/YmgE family stress response membrane protein [Patescibacteria group bacterium]|jgi:uncharacterized membrane protein YeaQ/YmgE (transglycosylase-associated protein family)
MGWIVTIIVGGIIGWIASLIMRTKQGVIADIIIGILGSILGVWLFAEVFGFGPVIATPGTLSLLNVIWGIIGAIIVIALIEAVSYETRGMKRYENDKDQYSKGVAHEYEEDKGEEVIIVKKKRPTKRK